MFCNECGAKNPDGSKFCSGCGAKLMQATPAVKESGQNNKEILDMFEEVIPETNHIKNEVKPKTIPVSEIRTSASVEIKPEPTPVAVATSTSQPAIPAEANIQERLASLSTAGMMKQNKVASRTLNPIEDPYWDDVLPEIDNEIYAIPKDNIIKVLASIGATFLVIVYLIFML